MEEGYMPGIPAEALCEIIESSEKIIETISVGSTFAFILKGSTYIGKRTITLRKGVGDIDYEYAIGVAVRAGVLAQCMSWFEKNKAFKEGGYFVDGKEEPVNRKGKE